MAALQELSGLLHADVVVVLADLMGHLQLLHLLHLPLLVAVLLLLLGLGGTESNATDPQEADRCQKQGVKHFDGVKWEVEAAERRNMDRQQKKTRKMKCVGKCRILKGKKPK